MEVIGLDYKVLFGFGAGVAAAAPVASLCLLSLIGLRQAASQSDLVVNAAVTKKVPLLKWGPTLMRLCRKKKQDIILEETKDE